MACPPKKSGEKRRKRLPSINPFFHFLKHLWKTHKNCKRSVVVAMAVKKWQCMSKCEKQPFYNAACRAQRLHRKAKKCQKPKPKCPKSKMKPKQKCPKPKMRCPKPKPKCPKKKSMKSRCPPHPPCTPPAGNHKK